ncbi:hypothetical protein SVIOM74S_01104 [Streptomyces violarus]
MARATAMPSANSSAGLPERGEQPLGRRCTGALEGPVGLHGRLGRRTGIGAVTLAHPAAAGA